MRMDQNFLQYSGLDAACTMEIYQKFWEDLSPTFSRANELTMSIIPVLMFMQTRGVKVNRKALAETKQEVLRSAAEKQEALNKIVGYDLNVNSSKQVCDYFYHKLGIPAYKNYEGNPTADDKALQRLVRGTAARPGLPQAKLIQEIRGLQKLHSTYLNMEFDSDDRIRCSYNPRGTKFGRLSSSKTIFGTGMNMQNLPPEFKKFLEADPGYVFVEVDKRQAEWVVVAYATGDANMIAAVEQGLDVHVHTASGMFNVSSEIIELDKKLCGHSSDAESIYEARMSNLELVRAIRECGKQWTRTMSLRQCGKKSNHGLNYDEGYRQFAMIYEIEEAEAKRIVAMYHHLYPGIKIWYESIKRQLSADRILTNCFGRSIRFLGSWDDKTWKSAYAAIPQSTVVDSLNDGMRRIYEDEELSGKRGLNLDILAQVHDSVLMQVPISNLLSGRFQWFIDKVKDYTSPLLHYSGRDFKIASDFKFGMNWGEFSSEKNPGGMQEFETFEAFTNALKDWEKLRVEGTLGMA